MDSRRKKEKNHFRYFDLCLLGSIIWLILWKWIVFVQEFCFYLSRLKQLHIELVDLFQLFLDINLLSQGENFLFFPRIFL